MVGIRLEFNTGEEISNNNGMMVVVYIDDIFIAMKGAIERQQRQVSKVLQLLLDNDMFVEIAKCIFVAKHIPFAGILVSGSGLKIDPDKVKASMDSPSPMNRKEVQQLLGLWNFSRRLLRSWRRIVSPLPDLLRGEKKSPSRGDQGAVFLKLAVLFILGKTTIQRHYNPERPA